MALEKFPGVAHYIGMHKRSSRPDFAQTALKIVEISTGQALKPVEKNVAAVALGRLGGLKGGKARAAKLTDIQRREIASIAARKRWQNKDQAV